MTTRPRILAADLSLSSTGLAWTGDGDGIGIANICPADDRDQHTRLNHHLIYITELAERIRPHLAVIELLASFPGQDQTHIMGGLNWLVRHALWLRGIPYKLVHPKTLKIYATGDGGASKQAVLVAMQQMLYPKHVRNDDEADAGALLALACDAYGAPLADLPPEHRRAIKSVKWPALDVESGGACETTPPPPDPTESRMP